MRRELVFSCPGELFQGCGRASSTQEALAVGSGAPVLRASGRGARSCAGQGECLGEAVGVGAQVSRKEPAAVRASVSVFGEVSPAEARGRGPRLPGLLEGVGGRLMGVRGPGGCFLRAGLLILLEVRGHA